MPPTIIKTPPRTTTASTATTTKALLGGTGSPSPKAPRMLRLRPEYWASRHSSQIWSLLDVCQVFHRDAGLDAPEHLHDDPRRFVGDGPAGTRPRIGVEQPARLRLAPATAPRQSFGSLPGGEGGLDNGR